MKDQSYISDDAVEDVVETRTKKRNNKKGKQPSATNEKSAIEQIYTSDDASAEDSVILKEIQPKQKARKTAKKPVDQKPIPPVLTSQQTYISDDTTEQSADESIVVKDAQPKRRMKKRGKKATESDDVNNQHSEENLILTGTKTYTSDDTIEQSAEDTIVADEKGNGKNKKRGKKISPSAKKPVVNDAEKSAVTNDTALITDDSTECSTEENKTEEETKHKQGKRKPGKKTPPSIDKIVSSEAKLDVVPTNANDQTSCDGTENSAEENVIVKQADAKRQRKRGRKVSQLNEKPIASQTEENTAPTETNVHFSDDASFHSAEENVAIKETENKRKRKQGKIVLQSNEKPSPLILETSREVKSQLGEETIIPAETQTNQDQKMRGKKRGNKISLSNDQGTPKKKQRTESVLNSTFSIESEEECSKIPAPSKIRKNSSGSWIESENTSKAPAASLTTTISELTKLEPKPVEVIQPITIKNVEVNGSSTKNQVKFKTGIKSLNVTLNETKNVTLRTPSARKSVGNINFSSAKKNAATPGTASKKSVLPSRDQSLTSNIPKLAKAKAAPNFSEIHKKNFMKMQSVDEYLEKKVQSRTASAMKNRDKSVVDGAATPRDKVKSRLFPTPNSALKINFVSGKLFNVYLI